MSVTFFDVDPTLMLKIDDVAHDVGDKTAISVITA